MDTSLSAQRRNLIATAAGFVIYNLGSGNVNPEMRLPIGITLDNPAVLTWAAWAALFWFWWRYYIIARDKETTKSFAEGFHKYLHNNHRKAIGNSIAKELGGVKPEPSLLPIARTTSPSGGLFAWRYILSWHAKDQPQRGNVKKEQVQRTGPWHEILPLKIWLLVRYAVAKPEFSDFWFPHMAAIIGLLAGLHALFCK